MWSIPAKGPGRATARDRVLKEWRGVDYAPLEAAWTDKAVKPSAVLPQLMGELRIEKRQTESEVVKVWNQLLDPSIVTHAQPTGYRNGTLFVTVDNNVWLSEIVRYRQREILERLRHSFGSDFIKKISFRVG